MTPDCVNKKEEKIQKERHRELKKKTQCGQNRSHHLLIIAAGSDVSISADNGVEAMVSHR